jgi:hypothetical protein
MGFNDLILVRGDVGGLNLRLSWPIGAEWEG